MCICLPQCEHILEIFSFPSGKLKSKPTTEGSGLKADYMSVSRKTACIEIVFFF